MNEIGTATAIGSVKLGDLDRPFMVWGIDEDQKIAEGDTIKLECGAIIYNHSKRIIWSKNGRELKGDDRMKIESFQTSFSYRKTITWTSISKTDSGNYECEVNRRDTDEYAGVESVDIKVYDASPPSIVTNFNQSQIRQPMSENLRLDCLMNGLPEPVMTWRKNGEIFVIEESEDDENQMGRVTMEANNASIIFRFLKPEDSGIYKCEASNRIGVDEKQVEIIVEGELVEK